MLRGGGRRGAMLSGELVVFVEVDMKKDLLAIRSRGGGHAEECPGLEPPGLMTVIC